MNKVILISIDGMRPDGFMACGNPYIHTLLKESSHCLSAQTVFPSVTLPCHTSMFHSVNPQRHGILTNTFVPQVRPINGIMEQLTMARRTTAMCYNWDELRDLYRPGNCRHAIYHHVNEPGGSDVEVTAAALNCLREAEPDFLFLYLGQTDEKGGHGHGWMTPEYLECINVAMDCVKQVIDEFGDTYNVIITADHGGHDRTHGSDMPEDMTIPIFFRGEDFLPNCEIAGVSILDIAPTIASLMGIYPDPEWEGKSLA